MAPNGARSAFRGYLAVPVAQSIVQIGGLEAEICERFPRNVILFLDFFSQFLKNLQKPLGMVPNGNRSAFRAYLAVPVAQSIVQIGGLEAEI